MSVNNYVGTTDSEVLIQAESLIDLIAGIDVLHTLAKNNFGDDLRQDAILSILSDCLNRLEALEDQ